MQRQPLLDTRVRHRFPLGVLFRLPLRNRDGDGDELETGAVLPVVVEVGGGSERCRHLLLGPLERDPLVVGRQHQRVCLRVVIAAGEAGDQPHVAVEKRPSTVLGLELVVPEVEAPAADVVAVARLRVLPAEVGEATLGMVDALLQHPPHFLDSYGPSLRAVSGAIGYLIGYRSQKAAILASR